MVDLVEQIREAVEKKFNHETLETMLTWAADEIERLRKSNEHNEQAIRACNQKISELELWGKDYREQIAVWKARAGA